MKVKTHTKAGGLGGQPNHTLRVRTGVKAGGYRQHTLRVRTGVKSGGVLPNHTARVR